MSVFGAVADRLESAESDPRLAWRRIARPDQLLPPGSWRVFYLQGGRGSGKTRSGAQGLAELILGDPEPGGQFGIIAPTYRDAWTVMVEGESGILRALGTSAGEVKEGVSRQISYAHRSYGEVGLRTGHTIYVDSADDGALRVQGKNLRAAWCGEVGLWARWQTAWDESVKFAVRKGQSKIICDGTPKVSRPAARLIRRLIRGEEPGVIVRRLRTIDNVDNLSEAFYDSVIGMARGTRLERQELEGELLDDVENALWTRDLLDSVQEGEPVFQGNPVAMMQVFCGIDPSDGKEESDEQAYTISALGNDNLVHVLESWGGQLGPVPFLKKALRAALEWHQQPTLVVEKNHGGAYLEETLKQVQKDLGTSVRVRTVHASEAKRTRAEPVAALYERGHARHAYGPHVELEDQMASFTGGAGERSPDRLDSLVWSVSPLLKRTFGQRKGPASAAQRWAAQDELDKIARSRYAEHGRRLRGGVHDGQLDGRRSNWDLDSWAPKEAEGGRPRRNIHGWR